MAYSPSPQPGALAAAGSSRNLPRISATPPPNQAVSKRDKRKNALTDRLRDISANFANNRDVHYRQQLQTYQVDMSYINEAKPYENKPLDDLGDDIIENINETVASSTQGGQRATQIGSHPRFQAPPRAGKWAATFVQEVNASMEERDTQLTLVADHHNRKIHELQEDKKFLIKVAQEEHRRLTASVRARLIYSITANKNALSREKDKFDIADTNALRFHPGHFSITNPASPGGPQSNRKTRHTRHRIDVDDLSAVAEGNKRKRKAPADADNDSPGPNGRVIEAEASQAWKDTQDAREAHENAPLYTIDRLFSERDLDMNMKLATIEAVKYLSSKRAKPNGDAQDTTNLETHANENMSDDDEEEEEDENIPLDDIDAAEKGNSDDEDIFLAAPEMDRTANNSVHATRSTRTMGLNPNASGTLGEMAGRIAAINSMSTKKGPKPPDDNTKGGTPLTEAEALDDLAMMEAAIKDETENVGKANRKMLQNLVPERQDHVSAAITGRNDLSQSYISTARPPFSIAYNPTENTDELYN